MTPEQARKVNDLRMKALEAMRTGVEIRSVLTREELTEALAIIRESRRSAAINTSQKGPTRASSSKKVETPVNPEELPDELKSLFS